MAALIEQMPDLVAAERKAVLEAIDDKAATFHNINTDVQTTLDRLNTTFTGLHQTTTDIENLLAGTRATAAVANDLLASVNRLMARLDSGKSAKPSKPFDINEYITAAQEADMHMFI